ncbi:unnamed protein product [Hermetia illucens]|uniref:DUF4780 domain-containing protein n=1 Tax=Hermetia illucens TaxID=343691 RepID=A0A7R8YS06_HERIL|nr:unnamed protein product [Hermetia illucens]
MSTKLEKKTKTKKAGPRTAPKLVNQVEARLRITESQVTTPKKGEVGTSSSGSKVSIGILHGLQPTNTTAQRAGTSKSTSEINITDVRKETGLSGAGVKWYLRYLKEGLKPEEALKKAQDRPKPSLPEPRKRGAAEISPHEGNAPKKPRPEPTGGENPGRSRVKAGPRKPGISYASAVKGIRLAILPKRFPEQILTREEQETIEELVVKQMIKGWTSKLVFTGIRFRPGLILVDCATEGTAEWVRTIIPRLPGWEGVELSTCAGDDIPGAHMVTVFLPKAAAIVTEDLMRLLIAQNEDLHTRLWRVFRSKVEGKGKLLTIGVDDRSLEAIKRRSCHINYRFGNIPVHVHKEKPRKETSEEASGGKLTEVPEEVAEAIEAERTGSTREVDLLPSEEQKLDDLDLGLLGLGVDSDAQESAMSEEEGDTPTVEKSSKQ